MKGAIQIQEMKPTVITEARGGNILLQGVQTFIDLVLTGGVESVAPPTGDNLLYEDGAAVLYEDATNVVYVA